MRPGQEEVPEGVHNQMVHHIPKDGQEQWEAALVVARIRLGGGDAVLGTRSLEEGLVVAQNRLLRLGS